MTDIATTDDEGLRTVVHDGPDGIVLALHGYLSRLTVPAVDSLLSWLQETERDTPSIDLRGARVEPAVAAAIAARWHVAP